MNNIITIGNIKYIIPIKGILNNEIEKKRAWYIALLNPKNDLEFHYAYILSEYFINIKYYKMKYSPAIEKLI